MRLIDRDKIISDMFDLYIENNWKPSDVHFSLLDIRANIDLIEYEVEAIPIEWFESWKRGKTDIEQIVADKIMMDYKYRRLGERK